jgi:formylmethanofuran dehydrogenase subunit C
VKGPKSARLIILGIRKKYRHVKRFGGLSAALYVEMNDRGKKLGMEWGELSWTLEDNAPVNLGIKMMGGKIYKKYRVFSKDLA